MNNSISRQAAIDALEKAMCEDGFRSSTGLIHKTTAYEIIRHLPSVQPKQRYIIRKAINADLTCIDSEIRALKKKGGKNESIYGI